MNTTRNFAEGCVMARIMRDTKTYQKNFAISRYENWDAAEKAALAWLRKLKKTLPPSRMNEEGRMTSSNSSGVVGIYLSKVIRKKPNGKEYSYWKWIARWQNCPIKAGVTWTINQATSDEDAFTLACLSREMRSTDRTAIRQKLTQIYGRKSHLQILEKKMLRLV